MEEPLNIPSTSLVLYMGLLYCLSILALGFEIKTDLTPKRLSLAPWRIGWLESSVFLLILLGSFLYIQLMLGFAIQHWGDNISESVNIILSGLATHGSVIGLILAGKRFYPNLMSFQWNATAPIDSPFPIRQAVITAFASLLLVSLTVLGWRAMFLFWDWFGFSVELEPQYVVTLISEADSPWVFLALASFAVVLAPLSEELLFRVCIYRGLKNHLPAGIAAILSALPFSLAHFSLTNFLGLFLLGLLLCRTYERTGKVFAPMILHSLFNLNSIILLAWSQNAAN